MADMKEDASPPSPQRARREILFVLQSLAMIGWLALVGVATLSRGDSSGRLPLSCVTCTDLWLLDIIQNVALFVPFGWLARRLGMSAGGAVLLGSALSFAIEGAQWSLPGLRRDPILGDLLANAAGVGLGVALVPLWRWWTRPGPVQGRLALALGWSVAGWLGSQWLLQPDWPADSEWFGQGAAQLGHLDTLPGLLMHGAVNGIPVPFRLPSARVHEASDTPGQLAVEAVVVLVATSDAVAPAVSVYDGRQREVILLGVRGDQIVLRARTRSAAIGLPSPLVGWPLDTETSGAVRLMLRARVVGRRWCLMTGEGPRSCEVLSAAGAIWRILSAGAASGAPPMVRRVGEAGGWVLLVGPAIVLCLTAGAARLRRMSGWRGLDHGDRIGS